MSSSIGEINPESSDELTGIKIKKPKKVAAGIPAVISSINHIIQETGLIRGFDALSSMNQTIGFDCPGCAWPDPDDDRSQFAEYCENGAKAIAEEATKKILKEDFFQEHSIYQMSQWSDFELGKKGRIGQPMYLAQNSNYYEPISWSNAFQKIGKHLNQLSNPNEAVFYTSGRTSNEAAFLYQLFVRAYGTNNLPDCSNMCHESSGVALNESLGIGKGSVTLEDFYISELIIIIGQNPGTNHPRMLTALQKAKKNNVKIISINPLEESGLIAFKNPQELSSMLGSYNAITDLHLPVKINGDLALLQAIIKKLYDLESKNSGSIFDLDFIKENTENYEQYVQHISQIDVNLKLKECDISTELLDKAVNLIYNKKKIIVCWAMGLTQHQNAVNTIKEVVNLILLKGSIGKPGTGTCPVRGHSNVQGDRTMGIYEKPSKEFIDSLKSYYQINFPYEHGLDVVDSIKAMHECKAKVFVACGGNFLSATPDTHFTAKALQKCQLTVQISTKLNRSHLIHGKEALILPCLSRSDRDITGQKLQFVSCENSMGVVQMSKGNLEPISSQFLSEVAIVCNIASNTLKNTTISWKAYENNYDSIRDAIENVIPGFNEYNKRVREKGGFYLPNCNKEGVFKTNKGKAIFNVSVTKKIELQNHEFLMMTIRSHDQFNTTIYGLNDRYRGIFNERRVILMNKEDIKQLALKQGDLVDLYNYSFGAIRIAKKFIIIEYNITKRCVATYFPETNVLIPIQSVAEKSNTPTSKSVIIEIKKH